MGRHRNSSYACYAVLFADGQLIAINIDSLRLPSTRLRRFDEALVASTRCCGKSFVRLWRQAPHSRPVSATDHHQAAGKSEVGAAWPACDARKIGVPTSRAARDQSFQLASRGRQGPKTAPARCNRSSILQNQNGIVEKLNGREHCR